MERANLVFPSGSYYDTKTKSSHNDDGTIVRKATMINSIEDLQQLVQDGVSDFSQYGHVRTFECGGMIGFDYTEAAEFEGTWNYFERISRGLVLDRVTGEVLARPYDKFFNLGQHNAYPKTKIRYALDKDDGSLGIVFRDQHEELKANTRGSFSSDQAVWLTEYLTRRDFDAPLGCTVLGEIIYPENRIVVDYCGWSGFIVHGVRCNTTGQYWSLRDIKDYFEDEECVEVVHTLPIELDHESTIEEQLGVIQEYVSNLRGVQSEGTVIVTEDGERFKIKGEDYLRLHRLVTDVTPKRVWELLCAGEYAQYRKEIPDEFLKEFDGYAKTILEWVREKDIESETEYQNSPVKDAESQKDFAIWVNSTQPVYRRAWMFQRRSGRDLSRYYLEHWKKFTGYTGA